MEDEQFLIELATDLGDVELLGELKQDRKLVNDLSWNKSIIISSILLTVPATIYLFPPLVVVPIVALGYHIVPKLRHPRG
jgi:hypothetical protein